MAAARDTAPNTGHRDDLVAAGVLHDTIENSGATTQDIETIFGSEISKIVAAVTEDPTIENFDQRKAARRQQIADFGPDATRCTPLTRSPRSASSAAVPPAGRRL